MGHLRYVAIGDSQTEGLTDGDEISGYRGWADRLADLLAEVEPGVTYANLAVRGRLTADIRAEQLAPALALEPDLVTVMAGMNDMIRPGFDLELVAGDLEEMYASLRAVGAQVVTFTFPDISLVSPLFRRFRPRVLALNARIEKAAAQHGVLVIDTFPHAAICDPRLWNADRIHAAPLGHARMAAAAAHALGLPGSDASWADPVQPPLPPVTLLRRTRLELTWAGAYLGPWLLRRLRGHSSGEGRTAKRPDLLPVRPG